ncbi:alpha-L-rhamnosidase-related protein [Spirosoma radiotolerans]|uniref:Alpha-rhamnosidase n=1 Tax=Spirosoma radiotolerans TaxID=1379870 RepID=A0A0E3ZUW3_9BACT|nr:alpha-L-rhamnosidase C-terminal domain-containing protein [Spirosoma radiotolerans]AKD55478.1 alpha-rhamnosidase [Spirosoma radiotolerans]
MKKHASFTLILLIFLGLKIHAQSIQPSLLTKNWTAFWIASSKETLRSYGIYVYRKTLDLPQKPSSFIVHVSADNRYKLYVNEKLVSLGPARGDLLYWNFETIDIAPYLQSGKNIIAAKVWNEGDLRPEAQLSVRTAFILQGNTVAEEVINTNTSWLCQQDSSYRPLAVNNTFGYYVAGPGESIRMQNHIKGWEKASFDDSNWKPAHALFEGTPKGVGASPYGWALVPSPIPPMELTPQRLSRVRKVTGLSIPSPFPSLPSAITVPANTKACFLLDQSVLTNAYPTLIMSRGLNAKVTLTYAEALNQGGDKGNRNEVEGKVMVGREDLIIADGSNQQTFTSLLWRTYRYIQLTIETKNEPLIIEDVFSTFTGYPFKNQATLNSEDPELNKMLDIGWRTARLCAFETYMDCPYYEQLQYIGDARIQALISFYNAGDDRLVRNALDLMDHSRLAEGVTQSRHPSATPQMIPPFSLWWIGMLHDYWKYRPDQAFVKNKLPGMRQVLSFFSHYQQPNGSLKGVPYWLFSDWAVDGKGWNFGAPPIDKSGHSALLDLHLLWTYQLAAELEAGLGEPSYAGAYKKQVELLKKTIQQKYWATSRLLYADTEEKDFFSQHTNTLAILTGLITGQPATNLARKIITEPGLAQASIYYKFYLHQALVKAGLGNEYLNWLTIWRENITLGLTTWGETSDVKTTRSDCHAWGASPNIEFFRTVLGIDSESPGFRTIKIEPHVGTLKKIAGQMPHPNGRIDVRYKLVNKQWMIQIDLPTNTSGHLLWKGKRHPLLGGKNSFVL